MALPVLVNSHSARDHTTHPDCQRDKFSAAHSTRDSVTPVHYARPMPIQTRGLLERPSSRARQSRAVSTVTSPKTTGSYPSFQPPGRPVPGVQHHHSPAVPSALPHDRRVRNVGPGHPTRSRWLETALFTATGWKCPQLVAEWVAVKPSCNAFGRMRYFRYSSQG